MLRVRRQLERYKSRLETLCLFSEKAENTPDIEQVDSLVGGDGPVMKE